MDRRIENLEDDVRPLRQRLDAIEGRDAGSKADPLKPRFGFWEAFGLVTVGLVAWVVFL